MTATRILAGIALASVTFAAGAAAAANHALPLGWDFGQDEPTTASVPPRPRQAVHAIDTTIGDPFIANGVSVGRGSALYYSSGTGPAALNAAAPAGTPEAYIDPAQFPDARLTDGVSITEAQGMNVLARVQANLANVGLTLRDVLTLRVYMDNAPGTDKMDFAGFNRAYRQFFANVNLQTKETIPQRRGTGEPAPPVVVNPVRPSRTAIEVASLPGPGWLVEIEAVARYGR
jgi:enamine deaminase RidA (YjgF/YER057c/UK114 family)